MKRNMMRKNLRRTIQKSLGRYIAIVAIIALGAGMFVGLLSTKTDMVATAQKFTDEQNMFDLRLISTYGWTAEDVAAVAEMAGVADAEGAFSMDVIARFDGDSEEAVYRLHGVPEKVNKVNLLGGRMPENPDECLVDGAHADDSIIGTVLEISETNDQDTLDTLTQKTFTVVGYVSTPLYMDMSRGNTTIGSGNLASYVYVPMDVFDADYFTEIGVTIEGEFEVYSDEFTDAMERMAEAMEPGVTVLAENRYADIRQDALDSYWQGYQEYLSGTEEYEQGKQEAMDKLEAGLKELQDGQAELDNNRLTIEDGEAQILDAQALLDENAAALAQSRKELNDAKAEAYAQIAAGYGELTENYKLAATSLHQVESGLGQINSGITQLEDALAQIDSGISQIDSALQILDVSVQALESVLALAEQSPVRDEARIAELEAQLTSLRTERDGYVAQRQELADMRVTYSDQLTELQTQKAELEATKTTLDQAMLELELGMMELENSRTQADNQFLSAQAQIESGQMQLDAAQAELDLKKLELEEGKAALADARAQLDEGWAEYEKGKTAAEQELAEAGDALRDARAQLAEGRDAIFALAEPEVYILNRNTNVGYLAVDSNSDIVAGVSRVFPVFFLLVAALVCITTMTRMVEEERTQIGTLKALGYSNWAIISKYLKYSGSAAILGCGLGVMVGSAVFPNVLWAAYSIILNLTPGVVLKLDWPLCIAVVAAYTAVSMVVTWYCCGRTLREVPAQLIRPKAPAAGKKILLEYLPFWKKISFLNKVMFRNVFRYRQRLLMMLVGIGGCTALLLTGFGVGDSIMNIVDYQFAEVTVYDMEVYFAEGQTDEDQAAFREELRRDVDEILFFHQTSVELDYGDKTREVYMMVSDEKIGDFIDFHTGETALDMPGVGETYLTIGAAEAMGIRVGDSVTIRNADMDTLTVKVTGIFDNHVYNYAVVRPETIEAQWGETPEQQMAFVTVRDTQDPYATGAKISGMADVMNVSVSQALAEHVGSMLDAMNLVVLTIVICAGLLAVIVLYNLTNINITERVREIATIKVLGFNSGESAAYVFKENLLLSGMGTAVGLVGGVFLLDFVMSQIKIDMVWFQDRLEFSSYLWAVVLTMLAACLVDFLLYFKLEKINMAEALKSVE